MAVNDSRNESTRRSGLLNFEIACSAQDAKKRKNKSRSRQNVFNMS